MSDAFIACINRFFTTSNWISLLEKGEQTQILNASLTAGSVVLKQFDGFNDLTGKVVLDLGCGSAGKSLYYATSGAREVIGVDVEVSSSAAALSEAQQRGLSLRVVEVPDGEPLPLDSASVDVVIASSVLEHIRDVPQVLGEIRRVLKIGGLFLNRWHPFHTRFGSHLHHVIGIPFAHCLFSERSLMRYYHSELLRRYGKVPASLRNVGEHSRLNDIMFMNRLTIAEAANAYREAKFMPLALRYFRGTKAVSWLCRLPQPARALVADYEINVLQRT